MNRLFTVIVNDSENKYIEEKSTNVKFLNGKYEGLRKIAIEVDCTIDELINCIIKHNLLERVDDRKFK